MQLRACTTLLAHRSVCLLSLSPLKLLEHTSHTTSLATLDAHATSASLWLSMPSLYISLQPALDLLAPLYHSLTFSLDHTGSMPVATSWKVLPWGSYSQAFLPHVPTTRASTSWPSQLPSLHPPLLPTQHTHLTPDFDPEDHTSWRLLCAADGCFYFLYGWWLHL